VCVVVKGMNSTWQDVILQEMQTCEIDGVQRHIWLNKPLKNTIDIPL
jgi:hypothetical protein